MAISVVVTVGEAGDKLVEMVRERIGAIHVGDGLDAKNDMGPLVTGQHLSRVRQYVDEGVAAGATLVADGRDLDANGSRDGFFLGPCLFDHVRPDMTIYRDEIFGPVLSVVRAESYDEALRLINDNPYANGVAIFTSDGGAARRFQNEVQVGMVGSMCRFRCRWRTTRSGVGKLHSSGMRMYMEEKE
jgi:malonate-semialdehyde dehydrogenase (acetylating)/methylmalonate-semialdehyde dehydrogenase